MPDQIIGAYKRPNGEEVRAVFSEFKDRKYFSIRTWYESPAGSGEWRPGKNGINLPVEEFAQVSAMVEAFAVHIPSKPDAKAT